MALPSTVQASPLGPDCKKSSNVDTPQCMLRATLTKACGDTQQPQQLQQQPQEQQPQPQQQQQPGALVRAPLAGVKRPVAVAAWAAPHAAAKAVGALVANTASVRSDAGPADAEAWLALDDISLQDEVGAAAGLVQLAQARAGRCRAATDPFHESDTFLSDQLKPKPARVAAAGSTPAAAAGAPPGVPTLQNAKRACVRARGAAAHTATRGRVGGATVSATVSAAAAAAAAVGSAAGEFGGDTSVAACAPTNTEKALWWVRASSVQSASLLQQQRQVAAAAAASALPKRHLCVACLLLKDAVVYKTEHSVCPVKLDGISRVALEAAEVEARDGMGFGRHKSFDSKKYIQHR
eukprot:190788-Chlamydomonas_euryale.AAC.1